MVARRLLAAAAAASAAISSALFDLFELFESPRRFPPPPESRLLLLLSRRPASEADCFDLDIESLRPASAADWPEVFDAAAAAAAA